MLRLDKCKDCPGCPVAPKSVDEKDPIKFEVHYDCQRDGAEGLFQRFGEHYTHGVQGYNQRELWVAGSRRALDEHRAREIEIEKRAQQRMQILCAQYPWLEPLWQHFMRRQHGSVVGQGYDDVVRLVEGMASVLVAYQTSERDKYWKQYTELLELCHRLAAAFDGAQNVVDMQQAVEELDSAVYEIEKGDDHG